MKIQIGIIAISVILFGCGGGSSSTDSSETSGVTDTTGETQNSTENDSTAEENSNNGIRIVKIKSSYNDNALVRLTEFDYDSKNRISKSTITDVNGIELEIVDFTYDEDNNLTTMKTSQDTITKFYYEDNRIYKRTDAFISSETLLSIYEVQEWDGDKPTFIEGINYDVNGAIATTFTQENIFTDGLLTRATYTSTYGPLESNQVYTIVYGTTYDVGAISSYDFLNFGNDNHDPATIASGAAQLQQSIQSSVPNTSSSSVFYPTYNGSLLESLETIKTDEDGTTHYSLEEYEYSN